MTDKKNTKPIGCWESTRTRFEEVRRLTGMSRVKLLDVMVAEKLSQVKRDQASTINYNPETGECQTESPEGERNGV